MMAVDLFATLIKSIELSNVTRFILVGDPNQLPPIGPGRPFGDIVKWLKDNDQYKGHLGLLSERVRQKSRDSVCLNLADGFLRDFKSKDVESIYNLMEQDKLNVGDLHFTEWKEYDELMQQNNILHLSPNLAAQICSKHEASASTSSTELSVAASRFLSRSFQSCPLREGIRACSVLTHSSIRLTNNLSA